MGYSTEHGKQDEEGLQLGESISGAGVLPCGKYTVRIVNIHEGALTVEEPARGTHSEVIPSLPPWIGRGDEIEITIGLSKGVYAKIDRGKVALFDSTTGENVTGWQANLAVIGRLQKKYTTAQPIIHTITKRKHGAALTWRRDKHGKQEVYIPKVSEPGAEAASPPDNKGQGE